MTTKITLPQLGESIHEGTIGKWLKAVGDTVEEFEPIVEIITDKVNAEVPSPIRGTLSAITVQEGETVEVGVVIGEMEEVGAVRVASEGVAKAQTLTTQELEAAFAPASTPQAAELNATVDGVEASFPNGTSAGGWYEDEAETEDTFAGASLPALPVVAQSKESGQPNRYSPAVRRLAEEHQLDLSQLGLRGSGLGGRVTRDDVLQYVEGQRQLRQPVPTRALPRLEEAVIAPTPVAPMHESVAAQVMRQTPPPPGLPPLLQSQTVTPASVVLQSPLSPVTAAPRPALVAIPAPNYSEQAVVSEGAGSGDQFVSLTPMRRAIAEHMVRSVQTSPHAWTMVEVDVTRLVRYRAGAKEEFKRREGVDLTYLSFVVKAVVDGLREFPAMNASWAADGSGVIVKRDLNIGVAVDVPDGLVVPVLHRADEKSLVGLARGLNDLVNRARNRKLTLPDVQGGSFTVNNPGWFGSVMSQPIINQPQAGIVTMEAIVKRPVVLTDAEGNDTVVVRSMMNMCLSFDHRIIDGATAGRFLQFLKKWLETREYGVGF